MLCGVFDSWHVYINTLPAVNDFFTFDMSHDEFLSFLCQCMDVCFEIININCLSDFSTYDNHSHLTLAYDICYDDNVNRTFI